MFEAVADSELHGSCHKWSPSAYHNKELQQVCSLLCNAGFLTKAQLQAALHSLALLDSKPAVFSSSSLRPGSKPGTAMPSRQAHRQSRLVDSLWDLLTSSPTDARRKVAATHRRFANANATLHQMPADVYHHAANTQQQPTGPAMLENDAESFDSLLSQGFDLWQQLTGGMDIDDAQDSQLVDLERPAVFPVAMAESAGSTCVSHAKSHPLRQPVRVQRSGMHGVSLQQLLSFVQLVQQQSTVSSPARGSLPAMGGLSQQQLAELNRFARMCSLNKQANMAYIGIGNRKLHQQPIRQAGTAMGMQPLQTGSQADAVVVGQQKGIEKIRWQPRGEPADLSWLSIAACFRKARSSEIIDKAVKSLHRAVYPAYVMHRTTTHNCCVLRTTMRSTSK